VRLVRVRRLWPPWVAARANHRTIYLRDDLTLTTRLLAHELRHIQQREHLGPLFLAAYLLGWARAGFRYERNPLEREAHAAESDPRYLAWADDLLAGDP